MHTRMSNRKVYDDQCRFLFKATSCFSLNGLAFIANHFESDLREVTKEHLVIVTIPGHFPEVWRRSSR